MKKRSPIPALIQPDVRQRLRRRLAAWYTKHARNLPWRRTSDPYQVWISEVMLQQTQVETVIPYFDRFIAALPTVGALAAADEQQVLRLWEGLGYYRRARQLHQAARQIEAQHAGVFPRRVDALCRLPGIGRYTAGAILSIAFDIRVPILEANTLRMLSRLIGYRGDPARAAGQQTLWQAAEELLPRQNAGRFNQALMELGSLVCTPRQPACDRCPLALFCAARAENLQEQIPLRAPKPAIENVREAAVVIQRGRRVLLVQYPDGQRWAGLWDFVRFPIRARQPTAARRELEETVLERTGVVVDSMQKMTTIRHGVTRFRITLQCHRAQYVSGRLHASPAGQLAWVDRAKLEQYPLNSTGRQLGRLYLASNGGE